MKLFATKGGIAQATAFDMIEKAYNIDLSPIKKLIPAATHETGFLNPSMIGERIGNINAKNVNLKLEAQELYVDVGNDTRWAMTHAYLYGVIQGKREERARQKNKHFA